MNFKFNQLPHFRLTSHIKNPGIWGFNFWLSMYFASMLFVRRHGLYILLIGPKQVISADFYADNLVRFIKLSYSRNDMCLRQIIFAIIYQRATSISKDIINDFF